MLLLNRRNYPLALRRGAFSRRGPGYSDLGIIMRCVREDQHAVSVTLYGMTAGGATLGFRLRKQEFFIPAGVMLRALTDDADQELFGRMVDGCMAREGGMAAGQAPSAEAAEQSVDAVLAGRAEAVLRAAHNLGLYTQRQALEYIGSKFRVVLDEVSKRATDEEAARYLLREFIFVHASGDEDKVAVLMLMLHKLWAVASGMASPDADDATAHHEVMLPGHLLLNFLRGQVKSWLQAAKGNFEAELRKRKTADLRDVTVQKNVLARTVGSVDIGRKFEYLLATGNLVDPTGLDLPQNSGFTVVAEKLNYMRYLSHFRSIHRGASFAKLQITTPRKLRPESWGFLCPVHTPDGSPCGLLNHLAQHCQVVTEARQSTEWRRSALAQVLFSLGAVAATGGAPVPPPPAYLTVVVDGLVTAAVASSTAPLLVRALRILKAGGRHPAVPHDLEVAHVPFDAGASFPGVFIFTAPGRMMRAVRQRPEGIDARADALAADALAGGGGGGAAASDGWNGRGPIEMIGTLEQLFLDVACADRASSRMMVGAAGAPPPLDAAAGDVVEGGRLPGATHEEMHPAAILSVVASLTPWSDHNQSPRNMYQCQMAKQTMGVPMTAYAHRPDTKIYRITTPQSPICRTRLYDSYHVDEYPLGTNSVVAVLAYTGYDMEDAMIINKSAIERGFMHGAMYKTETVDLKDRRASAGSAATHVFQRPSRESLRAERTKQRGSARAVDADGLPAPMSRLRPGDAVWNERDLVGAKDHLHRLKGSDGATVEHVAIVGEPREPELQKATVKLRYDRTPVIGDKFSSRHGQKGTLSVLWPDVDMPWCEYSGMRPDIIINPHAFPSRMTIGMLIESMAGKAGAMTGTYPDATPFQPRGGPEDGHGGAACLPNIADQLAKHGYSKVGSEPMYSGVLGTHLQADIYIGLVYYQRLRHMVNDKFQVRATGAVNNLTRQPVKGRAIGGGIRFGEMERDSLLSHGAAYLLHDRLHTCSDAHMADVCAKCGCMLATLQLPQLEGDRLGAAGGRHKMHCKVCNTGERVEKVAMPYVFRYLAVELASVNVALRLKVGSAA